MEVDFGLTSQLRPVKREVQVQLYAQVLGRVSLVSESMGWAEQEPPLRQGCPSQGSGGGVAWVGSAGAGVPGAGLRGEDRPPPPALSSSKRRHMGRCIGMGRRADTTTLHELILSSPLICLLFLSLLVLLL